MIIILKYLHHTQIPERIDGITFTMGNPSDRVPHDGGGGGGGGGGRGGCCF